jgi:mono/diheme cytochrome c family protein
MKKVFTVFSLSLIVFACTPKAAPVGTTTSNTNNTSNTTKTDSNTNQTATSIETSTTTSAPAVDESAVVEGHAIYTTKCGKCHGLKNPADFTSAKWDGILKVMAPKAKLSQTETAQVTAYVKANAKPAQP